MNRHGCRLLAEGARRAASRISLIISVGTGLSRNLRVLLRCRIASRTVSMMPAFPGPQTGLFYLRIELEVHSATIYLKSQSMNFRFYILTCHFDLELFIFDLFPPPSNSLPLGGRVGRHPARIYSRWDMGNGIGLR
jgi:hypothetical protein